MFPDKLLFNCTHWFAEDFTTEVRDECWDRIRIVLSQPFRKDRQMGLQFLRITEKREHGDDKISVSEF